MTPEAWGVVVAAIGAGAGILTTTIVQNATTRRLMIERQQEAGAKADTAARKATQANDAAETAARFAETAARHTIPVSNGTMPAVLRHLEDQGSMMVRMIKQLDQLTDTSGRTVSRLDGVQQVMTEHLADHARSATENARG